MTLNPPPSNFMKIMRPRPGDPLERKFSELMAEEERTHLSLLSDMKMYYEDPESWFMEKERSGLDGA